MRQENKELLLKDLCERLPYGVKAQVCGWDEEKGEVKVPLQIYSINTDGYVYFETNDYDVNYLPVEDVRPYLRPMSSMTEEEYDDMFHQFYSAQEEFFRNCSNTDTIRKIITYDMVKYNWLNKKMFDYRGLIPKGLAIEVTKDNNPYKD